MTYLVIVVDAERRFAAQDVEAARYAIDDATGRLTFYDDADVIVRELDVGVWCGLTAAAHGPIDADETF